MKDTPDVGNAPFALFPYKVIARSRMKLSENAAAFCCVLISPIRLSHRDGRSTLGMATCR